MKLVACKSNGKFLFRMNELIPIIVKYIKSRQIPGRPVFLVAHNARNFDLPFLENEFRRCSYEIPEDWRFIDSCLLAREAMKLEGKHSIKWLKFWVIFYTLVVQRSEHKKEKKMMRFIVYRSKGCSKSLSALGEYYGIPLESCHRAMSDVNLLSEVFGRLTFELKLSVEDLLSWIVEPKNNLWQLVSFPIL